MEIVSHNIIENIAIYLEYNDLKSFCHCNHQTNQLISNEHFWQTKAFFDFGTRLPIISLLSPHQTYTYLCLENKRDKLCFKGLERYVTIDRCLARAVYLKDQNLFSYFLESIDDDRLGEIFQIAMYAIGKTGQKELISVIFNRYISSFRFGDSYFALLQGVVAYQTNKISFHLEYIAEILTILTQYQDYRDKIRSSTSMRIRYKHDNDLEYLMYCLLERGRLKLFKRLLENFPTNFDSQDLLLASVKSDQIEIVQFILNSYPMDPTLWYDSIRISIRNSNLPVLQQLYSRGANDIQSITLMFRYACEYYQPSIIAWLSDKEFYPAYGLSGAVYGNHLHLVQALVAENKFDMTCYNNAITECRDIEIFRYLVTLGANRFDPVLKYAISKNNYPLIQYILNNYFNVLDIRKIFLELGRCKSLYTCQFVSALLYSKYSETSTVIDEMLHLAIMCRNLEIIRYLISVWHTDSNVLVTALNHLSQGPKNKELRAYLNYTINKKGLAR